MAMAKCRICGEERHILIPHLAEEHQITSAEDLTDYVTRHGGDAGLLASETGWAAYREAQSRSKGKTGNHPIIRPKKRVPVMTLLPSLRSAAKVLAPDGTMKFREYTGEVEIYAEPHMLTPSVNPFYIFPEAVIDLITCLNKGHRNRPYIQGLSGTGKTELVKQYAAVTNAALLEINGDQFLEREHLIGGWTVEKGETKFRYGLVPQAMMNGYLLAYHEWDTQSPIVANIFKPVLEDRPYLTIEETGEMIRWVEPGQPIPPNVIPVHPDFRIVATANTWGRGDDTGLFGMNTNVQSDADMRRWSFRIGVDYMPQETEVAMLKGYFGPQTPEDAVILDKMVQVANTIRTGFREKKIDKTFSPAELINWAENAIHCGRGVHHAARVSFLAALQSDVAMAISEMINAVFGHEVLS